MVTTTSQAKSIFDEWSKLKSDKQRLDYLCDNAGNLKVMLDNDQSFVGFISSNQLQDAYGQELEDLVAGMNEFDQYFGDNEGVELLFKKLSVVAESV